jgi:phosphate transport system substrate-binding protein
MINLLRSKLGLLFVFVISAVLISSCGKGDKDKTSGSEKELLGAGATFPYPLYSKMFDVYSKENNMKVNYQSVGSGAGIQQLTNRTVDFGASDAFMTDEELQKAPGKVVEVPTCLGAVVITYNLPDNPELKFTPEIISEIFLGKIKKWNDEKIKSLNPDAKIADLDIAVVHRSDGSGTTFVFTDYLTKVSEEWKSAVGAGKSVKWPVGLGAKGNEGVGGLVKQTPGAIGYVELIFASQNKMPLGVIKNQKGNFIKPTLKSISAAANIEIPDDTRISITNTNSDEGYPIASFTWILLYQDQNYGSRSEARGKEVAKLIWWMTHGGQQYAEPLEYAALPTEAVKKAEAILKGVNFGGKPLLEEK